MTTRALQIADIVQLQRLLTGKPRNAQDDAGDRNFFFVMVFLGAVMVLSFAIFK
jgi:hypothetical protein